MILATLCYVRQSDKTLMIHRTKKANDFHEGKWNGLGGKFEPGETPEECAVREVQEESGLTMLNPKLHGFISFPMFDCKNDWYVFLFSANEYEGDLIDSPEGDLEWVPDEELLDLNLWEGDKIFLKWLLDDKFFSAKFNYKDGEFIDYSVVFY